MPRIRQVKPELFDDPDVGSLPAQARWLFVGLLTQADRAGRLVHDPRRLKARLCAYDNTDVAAALDVLDAAGLVLQYEVEGRRYLQIRSFNRHQYPHPKEPESVIPPFPEQNKRIAERQGKNMTSPSKSSGSMDLWRTGSMDLTDAPRRNFHDDDNGNRKVPDHRVLCAMARDEATGTGQLDYSEWAERVKRRVVAQGFEYPAPDDITAALDAVAHVLKR